uniref:NADH-ubiquinone oxidoreductase chain 2 n=2 Tax=Cnemaspis TaxID=221557 RepID=A0A7D0H2X9_9SAUR|nr:NADH dehydrogenase subunit 2 [Cnemaspis sp. 10 IA-2017]QDP16536.1 NADH dehydrogenase subunit 2 [Cnemaspis hitihami]QDP16537.1 NADH dehydrogenase subunit 2 [Cnemaspis hitihami]QDP16538.1 NADH dehydrogenase subunit 2 [Cnemaspis hitihami]
MNPVTWALFLTSLTTSTMIVMLSHHWLLAWLALELNTLSILPMIIKQHHPRATEAATKYFLTQATAAALILFTSTVNAWQTGQWNIIISNTTLTTTMITIALMLKLGLAPIHFWYPEVMQGSTLLTALLISTWQKIAPLTLLYMTMPALPTNMTLLIGMTSALIGGWAGLNQTQTRKIMAFSSIAHMGWLITIITMNPNLTTLTYLMYVTMTSSLFISLNINTTNSIANLSTVWSNSPTLLTTMMLTLMALGGLPPLSGFMPKWLILKELTEANLFMLSTIMAMASLPSLFFYIRMAYTTTLTLAPAPTNIKHNWRLNTPHKLTHATTMTATLFLLPMMPLLYTM